MRENITREEYENILGFSDIERFDNDGNCEILVCPFTSEIVAMRLQHGSSSKYILFEEAWKCVE